MKAARLTLVGLLFFSLTSFAQKRAPSASDDDGRGGYPKFTLDLGVSLGSYGETNYTEASLGLNTYFMDWFIWRNAGFGRFASGIDDVYGLDSSLRAVGRMGTSALGLTAFAGPGYRTVNKGDNAPFAEAGVILRLGGFSLGGGAKVLYYSSREGDLPKRDTIYFIILAGGATL